MDKNELRSHQSENSFLIKLKEDHLADLLLNFLGKKERLSYQSKRSFILRLNDIEQFYYLLNEKVSKEQHVNVEIFSVTFLFNDKTKRTVNTIISLNKYLETRDVEPVSVVLEWHIVLKFPNTDTIETQKIEVSFDVLSDSKIGKVLINIEHTNQSWGLEVLNLLKNQILLVSKSINKKVTWAKKVKELIDIKSIFFLLFTSSLLLFLFKVIPSVEDRKVTNYHVFSYYVDGNITKDEFEKYNYISNNIHEELQKDSVEKTIKDEGLKKYLLNNFIERGDKNNSNKSFFTRYIVSALLLWCAFYLYLIRYIKYHSAKSFIITTNRAVASFEEYNSIKNRIEFYSISLLVFTVVSGLIVNMLYSYF